MDELVASAEEAVCMQGLQGCAPERFVELLRKDVLPPRLGQSQVLQHASVLWRILVHSSDFEVLSATDSAAAVSPGAAEDIQALLEQGATAVVLRAKAKQVYGHVVENYVKNSNISPLVWRCLDFVASCGKDGATVVELGRMLDTTQSTVFYLVKTLVEGGLVAKIKCVDGGAFTNLIVHRKYLLANEAYQNRVKSFAPLDAEEADEDDAGPSLPAQSFEPYGRAELKIPQFVKARVRQLLRCDLWHHLIVNSDLLIMTGFSETPSRKDRVEFNGVTRKMVQDGELDVVFVPRADGGRAYRCFRLPEFRPDGPEDFTKDLQIPSYIGSVAAQRGLNPDERDSDDDMEDDMAIAEARVGPKDLSASGVPQEGSITRRALWDGIVRQRLTPLISMEYQMLAMIKHAGEHGLTYGELSLALDSLAVRTVEAIVLRAEYYTACPSGLSDMYVKPVSESQGKERRLRIFTLQGWIERCRQIGLDDDSLAFELRLATASDWMQGVEYGRYETAQQYQQRLLSFPARASQADVLAWRKGSLKSARTIGRPRKHALAPPKVPKEPSRPALTAARQESAPDMMVDLQDITIGRPRKTIKVIGPDGNLVKRKKSVVIPYHPELPAIYLYNEVTRVFFDVPAEYEGRGPVSLPSDWMTKTQPKKIVVPSTGKPPPQPPKKRKRNATQSDDDQASTPAIAASPEATETSKKAKSKEKGEKKKRKAEVGAETGDSSRTAGIARYFPPVEPSLQIELASQVANPVEGSQEDQQAGTVGPEATSAGGAHSVGLSGETASAAAEVAQPSYNEDRPMEDADAGDIPPAVAELPNQAPPVPPLVPAGHEPALQTTASVEASHPQRQASEGIAEIPEIPRPSRSKLVESRTNLTLYVKKVEFLRCIGDLGGIVEGGHAFSRTHKEWFISLQQNGTIQPTLQAFEMDKRTVDKVTVALLGERSIKKTIVALQEGNDVSRNIPVLSLPSVPPGDITAWIARRRAENAPPAEKSAHPERAVPKKPARSLRGNPETSTLQISLRELTAMDDDTVRQLFLQEPVIAAQSYGYLMGKFRRAHMLHDIVADLAVPAAVGQSDHTEMLVARSTMDSKMTATQYCQLLAVTTANPMLTEFFSDAENCKVPLSSAPLSVQQAINVRDRTMRVQLWRLTRMLLDLDLLEGRIYSRDMSSYETSSVLNNVTHFKLNEMAPLFNVGEGVDQPECLGALPLLTAADRSDWWYALWNLSMTSGPGNVEVANFIRAQTRPTPTARYRISDRADITRASKWQTGYQITTSQKRYLSAWQSADTRERLGLADRPVEELAYVLSAPAEPIAQYLAFLRDQAGRSPGQDKAALDADGKPLRRKYQRKARAKSGAADDGAAKAALQAAAEEAREKQQAKDNVARKLRERAQIVEAKWENLLLEALNECGANASEELVIYLKPIQKTFQRSPDTFNPRLLRAGIKTFSNRGFQPRRGRPPAAATAVHIPRPEPAAASKINSRGASKSGRLIRGHRTTWTKEYEDLAIDAWVIVQARCIASGLPWTMSGMYAALDNVIPGVDANKMRKKVAQLSKTSPAQEAYIDRLLEAWQGVYKRLRGTEALPDPNPESVTDFDLSLYINVLRGNIKKGILSRLPPRPKLRPTPDLLTSVEDIESIFAVEAAYKHPKGVPLLWDVASDERKEAALMSETPILVNTHRLGRSKEAVDTAQRAQKQIAVLTKMVCSHPQNTFVSKQAHGLLSTIPEPLLADVLKSLIRTEVIAQNSEEDERSLGRKFGLTSRYIIAFDSPYSVGLTIDAQGVSDEIPDQAFVDWPNDSTEGQYAGALSLNSHEMLSFEIDGTMSRCLRSSRRAYQTKLIDDLEIELSIGVQLNAGAAPDALQQVGVVASAQQADYAEAADSVQLMDTVRRAGAEGLPIEELWELHGQLMRDFGQQLRAALGKHIFLVGYDQPRLVDEEHFRTAWHVPCPAQDEQETTVLCQPRQWLDISGNIVKSAWLRCSTKVYSLIVQRPGISEHHLRIMLAPLLDRLEINDLLQELVDDERILRVYPTAETAERACAWKVGLAGQAEELLGSLYPRDGMW